MGGVPFFLQSQMYCFIMVVVKLKGECHDSGSPKMKLSSDMLLLSSLQGHMDPRALAESFKKLAVTGQSQNRWGIVSLSLWQKVQDPSPTCFISLLVFRVPLFILCWICL